jgi:hypothetical protein
LVRLKAFPDHTTNMKAMQAQLDPTSMSRTYQSTIDR